MLQKNLGNGHSPGTHFSTWRKTLERMRIWAVSVAVARQEWRACVSSALESNWHHVPVVRITVRIQDCKSL